MAESSLDEIAARLRAAGRIVLASHVRPDGDAIGSCVALGHSLGEMGKSVVILNQDPVPGNLAFLPGTELVRRPGEVPLDGAEIVVFLDTAARGRVGDDVLAAVQDIPLLINIDHHVSNDGYGGMSHVDGVAPATGQIVYDLMRAGGFPLTEVARDNLFVAISTDTGSFQYPSTTAATYRVAADLIEAGADVGAISQRLYESYPLRRIELLRELLGVLRIEADGRLASWSLSRAVADQVGLQAGDTEGLIDIIRAIDSVVVAAFIEELEDGRVRVSMRSKSRAVDVSRICGTFGGGGHVLAAGARLPGPLREAEERVVSEAINAIKNAAADAEE